MAEYYAIWDRFDQSSHFGNNYTEIIDFKSISIRFFTLYSILISSCHHLYYSIKSNGQQTACRKLEKKSSCFSLQYCWYTRLYSTRSLSTNWLWTSLWLVESWSYYVWNAHRSVHIIFHDLSLVMNMPVSLITNLKL